MLRVRKRKQDTTYAIRSRCPLCRQFSIEGAEHSCVVGGSTVIHTNPAAPKTQSDKEK